MAPVQRRLSYDALWRAAGRPSKLELARRSGIHVRQWQRWAVEGGVPAGSADRAAVALGLHPSNVWSDWYTTAGAA